MQDAEQTLRTALARHQAGDLAAAEQAYRQILAQDPENAPATHFLGMLAHQTGRHEQGLSLLRRSIELAAEVAEFHSNLATVYGELGRPAEAVKLLKKAVRLRPHFLEAHKNLGFALEELGRLDEAQAAYADAERLATAGGQPSAEFHHHVGRVLHHLGHVREAEVAQRRALSLEPAREDANFYLSGLYVEQGRAEEAALALQRLVGLRPDLSAAHSDLLFTLLHHPAYSPAALFDEHRQWAERHAKPLAAAAHPHDNHTVRAWPLRVGYVSPDFREHTVPRFFEPILRAHDRQQVTPVCYCDVDRPDAVTDRLRALAGDGGWRDVAGWGDQALARQIREDRVDILVDLTGHMARGRLTLFARKPAPVQVTYIGYPHSTGMDCIDARITDALSDPAGAEAYHTERLARLDGCAWCYQPDADAPDVNALPALKAGCVTFGSLNRPLKVNPAVLRCWARLLGEVPNSRLLALVPGKGAAALVRERYEQHGIGAGRLDIVAGRSRHEFLRLFHRVDLALDPFPYNGMTTTCDAMWMGVPTVTLAGGTHVSRVGLDLLSQVGLNDLSAETAEQYVQIAAALARDPDRLRALRSDLRDRMRASALRDEGACAARLERAYREAWGRWRTSR